jgi:branched-chain amino acid transport system substrate-binding protein
MQKLKLVAIAAACIAALGVQPAAHAADDEITIGFAIAQSGFLAAYDGPPLKGSLLAIDDINAKGGVLGRKLKAVYSDTKSDQTQGARAGQEVIANGANFMIVSCDYDFGGGAAAVANAHKMIVLGCASDAKFGAQGIGPYAFSMSNASVSSGASLAEWGWTKKGWRSAYVLLDTSVEYDKAVCGGFKTRWAKLGGKLLGEDSFKQDDASIASQVTRIQKTAADSGKIDFIMVCSYGSGAINAIRSIRAAGIETALGSGDSMDGDYWAKGIPHLNGFYAGTYGSPFGDDPRKNYNDFMTRSAEKNGGERPPNSFGICGYSQIQAIVLGIQRANSIDSDKVLAEMNKFKNEELAVGPTSFTPELHINLQRPQAILGIKDGKGSFVELVQLSEPPPVQLIYKK